ncbi:MAG: hypothetical protein MHMPM18_002656 [Marteilia pararefringens]
MSDPQHFQLSKSIRFLAHIYGGTISFEVNEEQQCVLAHCCSLPFANSLRSLT